MERVCPNILIKNLTHLQLVCDGIIWYKMVFIAQNYIFSCFQLNITGVNNIAQR